MCGRRIYVGREKLRFTRRNVRPRVTRLQGGGLSSDRFHPVTLGGSTSAPLLVRLQDNDAVIIAHRVACLDF